MSLAVSFLDFKKNARGVPLKQKLVRAALNNRKVTFEGSDWYIDGKVVPAFKKDKLSCIVSLYLNIIHRLKMLSCGYKKKYYKAIEHLTKVQIPKIKSVGKIAAIKNANMQQQQLTDCIEKFSKAEQKVFALQQELNTIDADYSKENQQQSLLLQECTKKEAALNAYYNARKVLLQVESKVLNKFFPSSELTNARIHTNELLNALQAFPDFAKVNFEKLDYNQIFKMREAQALLADDMHKKLSDLALSFKEKRLAVENELALATKEKEELQHIYKEYWCKMNQSPVKFKKRLTARYRSNPVPAQLMANLAIPVQNKPTDDIAAKKVPKLPIDLFYDTIAKKCHEDIAELWKCLLGNFKTTNLAASFKKTSSGMYELKLKKPLRLWIPSKDEKNVENPEGGVVFLLGNNENQTIVFALEDSKMVFKEGFGMFLKTPDWAKYIPLIKTFITAETQFIHYKSSNEVVIAGKSYGRTKERTKTMQQLLENWSTKAELLPDSKNWHTQNVQFIQQKIKANQTA